MTKRYFFPLQGITLKDEADGLVKVQMANGYTILVYRTYEQVFTELMNAEGLMAQQLY